MSTIFYYGTKNSTYGHTYVHYVLLPNFSRACMDSATIMKIVAQYQDTLTVGKPMNMIKLFNSDSDFIPGISQEMDKINKSCLVTIGFDLKANKPHFFVFYDSDGNEIDLNNGNRWLPNKIKK